MRAEDPYLAAFHPRFGVVRNVDLLDLRIVVLFGQCVEQPVDVVLLPSGAFQVVDRGEQVGERLVVVSSEVGETVVGQHDLGGLLVVHVDRRGLDRLPSEFFRGHVGVVPGEDLEIVRGVGADIDNDRPVLAAFAQAFRDCVHVAATRVRVVGAQILQPECFDLELAHFAVLLPKLARARDGVVIIAGRGSRPRG